MIVPCHPQKIRSKRSYLKAKWSQICGELRGAAGKQVKGVRPHAVQLCKILLETIEPSTRPYIYGSAAFLVTAELAAQAAATVELGSVPAPLGIYCSMAAAFAARLDDQRIALLAEEPAALAARILFSLPRSGNTWTSGRSGWLLYAAGLDAARKS